MHMKYVFGPVPSRRLGQSLGIDPIPMKTCNWNCVDGQLGRTSPPAHERRDYAPADEILAEVAEALRLHADGGIDWLTFVGSGEPTLHVALGEMITRLKSRTTVPIAVLTNGSLLYLAEVRRGLLQADAVLPSLDAGSEALYRRINRAVPELNFERLVGGLAAFRAEYRGRLWVEVMLMKGLNDSDEALGDLAEVLQRVRPDEVHVNLPVRPPAEPWVEAPDDMRIARAVSILGEVARVVPPKAGELNLAGCDDVVEAILGVIARHPMSEEELLQSLARWNPNEVDRVLRDLESSGRARPVLRGGHRYWTGAESRYVDEAVSRCHARLNRPS
jgi:wyosine [tRNA(Phe)-imidazoG37] synthetase (radical SAM superfamily)